MGLFTDFYNTVAKFFRPQEEHIDGEASKTVATNRLKLVLMQDRTNLTPKVLEQMRGEMIELLSKYLEMDKDMLELNFEQEGDQVALMLSIPVIRAKDEEEIGLSTEEDEETDDDEEEDSDEVEAVSDEMEESEDEEHKPKKKRSKKETQQPEDFSNEENIESNEEEFAKEEV